MEAHAHADGRRSPAEVYRELIPGHELMNAVTRAERARLGYEVAFVFTSPSILNERHPFFVPLLRAAETRAAYLGIDVVWIAPTLDDWIEETSLARAVAHGARGLAVFGGTHGNVEVLRRRWPALPSVFVESETFGARSAHVAIDNERAFERAVVHLAEGGRTRIATITGRLEATAPPSPRAGSPRTRRSSTTATGHPTAATTARGACSRCPSAPTRSPARATPRRSVCSSRSPRRESAARRRSP
jgi:hypothetical protein